jgi:uncharacterized protein YecE (DUF72 family)
MSFIVSDYNSLRGLLRGKALYLSLAAHRGAKLARVLYSWVRRLWIGTSGWSYKSWAGGSFYPKGLPSGRQLDLYATQFPTVELNTTFYRLPSENVVQGWYHRAPKGFVYAAKGSRFITQMKKLNVTQESIAIYFERVSILKEHLGPILWQLPPKFGKNSERLDRFLSALPSAYRYAVEFRHPSWLDEEVFDILRRHNVAHVPVSSMAMPINLTLTADFTYVRFHGLEGGAAHDYSRDELKPWVAFCRGALKGGRTVFVYFNNDINVRAPKNAREFADMVE